MKPVLYRLLKRKMQHILQFMYFKHNNRSIGLFPFVLGLTDPRYSGPSVYRTLGLTDPRAIGPAVYRILCLKDPRSIGL